MAQSVPIKMAATDNTAQYMVNTVGHDAWNVNKNHVIATYDNRDTT